MSAAVTAGIAKPRGAAVDGAIRKIAAAIGGACAAVASQFLALRVIDKSVRNIQLGIQREQQR
jgi:hypothetical protein